MLVAACIFAILLLAYQTLYQWEKSKRWTRGKTKGFVLFEDNENDSDTEDGDGWDDSI